MIISFEDVFLIVKGLIFYGNSIMDLQEYMWEERKPLEIFSKMASSGLLFLNILKIILDLVMFASGLVNLLAMMSFHYILSKH